MGDHTEKSQTVIDTYKIPLYIDELVYGKRKARRKWQRTRINYRTNLLKQIRLANSNKAPLAADVVKNVQKEGIAFYRYL